MLWLAIIGIVALFFIWLTYKRFRIGKAEKTSNVVYLDHYRKMNQNKTMKKVQKCEKCNKYKRLHFYASPSGKITGLCKECEVNNKSNQMLRI
ncbi:hypothetical protein [Paenibacillus gallinarum]|uniref:Uncharacterized protein n=1 Tax=Paenibacillus gallinarum TaxID=2762232 RepID=A0ABR8SWS8_9BACL|nr:hypothetical protein [Paenibacillus gallinarum]MBD7967958.1 hypothetical protein [Paenibacillus gallinarum]